MVNKNSTTPKSFKLYVRIFWLLVLAPFIGIAALLLITLMGKLPPTEALANPKTNLATEVYTADMKVIGRYFRENRSDVKYESLPDHLVNALIATEDARFHDHSGVDFISLTRAVVNLGKKGGGSTVSQQLAKMLFTEEYERISFFERAMQKPGEWVTATKLEKQYTKEEIVSLYLNRYDFLNQAVGIKSAAHIYFNKPVDSLRIEESAMLVGMLKNSSLYNPLRRPGMVFKRRNVVLNQMSKYGYLDEDARDSLKLMPLDIHFQRISHDEGSAPYFREMLRSKLKSMLDEQDEDGNWIIERQPDGEKYDLYGDGLKVYTTLDSRMQEHAEWAVQEYISDMLQKEFWSDLKSRNKSNWPFYNDIRSEDRNTIMNSAIKQSHRHKVLAGKICPDCQRPAFYINEVTHMGSKHWHCDEGKDGCSHKWRRLPEDSISIVFETPIETQVYSPWGMIDTLISPIDSIKYTKSIIHAGLVSIEPQTGHVKAWVGGIDYKNFQYDNVYLSRRQVGSTFKPFLYATALRFNKFDYCEELPNQKICIDMPEGQPPWCPDNSDFEYGDMVSLEYGLANSINTISAKLIKEMKPKDVIQLARDLGVKSDIPEVPSIALGVAQVTLHEMVAANSALVNHGMYIEPIIITRIEDKSGNKVYDANDYLVIDQGIDAKTAYLTVNMMKGVVDGAYSREKGKRMGTGIRLRMDLKHRRYDGLTQPMAGKTGTTQNNTDGWFMGLTPELVTGVWAGAQDPTVRFSKTSLGQGANTALPIYGFYLKRVYADPELSISQEDFPIPEGIKIDTELDCIEYWNTRNSFNFDSDLEESSKGLFD